MDFNKLEENTKIEKIMKLYNLKDRTQEVNFDAAVKKGLGRQQGLFFPETIPQLSAIDGLLSLPVFERNLETKL